MEFNGTAFSPYLFLVLAFVVPGIIIQIVYSMFTTRPGDVSEKKFIYFVSVGAVNFGLWSWLIYPLVTNDFFLKNFVVSGILWFVILLLGPAVFGLLLGLNVQKEWTRRILQFFGLRPVHILPTAWDGTFQKMSKPHWLLVRLKDGSEVAGYFGKHSWAASDSAERDRYIEEVYGVQEDDTWQKLDSERGILLRPEEILTIEMWPSY